MSYMSILLKKLPKEIIDQHIIPYTYETPPRAILEDIRNFTQSLYEFIRACERKGIRKSMVWYKLHNLILYDSRIFLPTSTTNTHENVQLITNIDIALFSRQFRVWNENISISIDDMDSFFEEYYGTFLMRFWWGLMTVQERSNLIQNMNLTSQATEN
jgi:hypothetical protein